MGKKWLEFGDLDPINPGYSFPPNSPAKEDTQAGINLEGSLGDCLPNLVHFSLLWAAQERSSNVY